MYIKHAWKMYIYKNMYIKIKGTIFIQSDIANVAMIW